jgi:1,4-dihydroxy-2-naphthoate octaprenyltransferase
MSFKDLLLHLRLPFSVFLMPIFLLAISQQTEPQGYTNIYIFIVLHFFVYPASNAFNSFWDKDEGSIGGLKNPPKVDRKLLNLAHVFDLIGLLLSFILVGITFAFLVLVYILVSRAYSWPKIRLKKYAVLSWLIVGLFQGAYIFMLVYSFGQGVAWPEGLLKETANQVMPIFGAVFSSLLLWSIYPITQVYQHASDKKAGDTTMSMVLGIRGTFYNTILFFSSAIFLSYFFLSFKQFLMFNIFAAPVALYTLAWFVKVYKDPSKANFQNTMNMNLLSSLLLNICFALFSYII